MKMISLAKSLNCRVIDIYVYHLVLIALRQVHLLKYVDIVPSNVDYTFMEFNYLQACQPSLYYLHSTIGCDFLLKHAQIDATSPYPRKYSMCNVVGLQHKAHCDHRE